MKPWCLRARALAIPTFAAAVLLAAAPTAFAHVTVSPATGTAGAYTVLTVSVPHGCDGSATTRVAIRIPEPILAVTPTRNPLYTVAVTREKLAQPITDAHGNTITERDAAVVYTARTPLPDGQRDAFELSLQLPDSPGRTLVFPTVQTCEKGETAWIETAAPGQDPHSLEHPAPAVRVTAAETEPPPPAAAESSRPTDSAGTLLGGLGLAAGLGGLALGGLALVRVNRRS